MNEIVTPKNSPPADYLNGRWRQQCEYFESKALTNQRRFMNTRMTTLISSWLTPIAIFIVVLYREQLAHFYDLVPLLLSTVAIGSYQWEELHNYGAQWAKFRLVAERLKGHRELYLQRAGVYRDLDDERAQQKFVEFCEGLIEGNDVNYFALMVDPLLRRESS